tara:strand:+ start:493 stop:894 length:402 start_codon:yes stop_codon:yes gene_type:complete
VFRHVISLFLSHTFFPIEFEEASRPRNRFCENLVDPLTQGEINVGDYGVLLSPKDSLSHCSENPGYLEEHVFSLDSFRQYAFQQFDLKGETKPLSELKHPFLQVPCNKAIIFKIGAPLEGPSNVVSTSEEPIS